MPQSPAVNRRVVLASRPEGRPGPANFRIEEATVAAPAEGQMLLRTLWLSLDPYMRGRMSDLPSYAAPVPLDGVMVGGTVARVVESRLAGFHGGDLVLAYGGWQDYALSDGSDATLLPADLAHPSYALGVLGMPGLTAYAGLLDIGAPRPGETVVVAAATGGVGSVVGQIARIKGCRAVGIAGGAEKCAYAVAELGFDACVDHRAPDLRRRLAEACPGGIDVYFENVGGAVLQAVFPLLNPRARVPLCGLIAQYNQTAAAPGPDQAPLLLRQILTKRIRLQGFIVTLDYGDRAAAFRTDMAGWLKEGRMRYREHVVEGLENAPSALCDLLEGRNFGKVVVRVGSD